MPSGHVKFSRQKVCRQCHKDFMGAANSIFCSSPCAHMHRYETKMLDPNWRMERLVAMAKNRAKEKHLPFNLDTNYITSLWDGKCAISGIPLDLGRSEKGKVNPYAPSIDRIVPSLGYVKGNVRIICYQANVALSEFGLEQFDTFVKLYIKNKET